jgi:undecaprenyl-diphosphatase
LSIEIHLTLVLLSMNELWAIIYGFIQGLTEFLPVSSSGHLALIPKFFSLPDPGVIFDLVMHLGTALAVMIYYRKDLVLLFNDFSAILKSRKFTVGFFLQNFLAATLCSFILILFIKSVALEFGRSGTLIGINLIVFGLLMFFSDKTPETQLSLTKERSLIRAGIIGVFQSFAIFPGVSRSGITLTAARFMGMSRLESSRFSFLLSLPIIMASITYKLPAIYRGEAMNTSPILILIGIIASFGFGLLTIHFFVKFISKMGLWVFTVYRIILGLIIFWFL